MKVIIAGGGLGGLLLAHKLVKEGRDKNIEVVILERDASSDARGQGIVIGLAQQGVDCINKTGLGEVLQDLMSEDSPRHVTMRGYNGMRLIVGRNWLNVKLANGKKASSLIPRPEFRQRLAKLLPEGIIKWDAKIVKVEQNGNKVIATLANGEAVEGDVIIGADGARSVIRQQHFATLLPDHLDIWNCWGTLSASNFNAFGSHRELLEDAKISLTRTNGLNGCSILAFVYYPKKSTTEETAEPLLFWSLSMPRKAAPEIVETEKIEKEKLRELLVTLLRANFTEVAVSKLVEISDTVERGYGLTSVNPAVFKKGSICPQETMGMRVTLLGDAAHKTTTQAGLGASAAFMDAIDLGDTILKKGDALSAQDLREYERRMCTRASWVVGASYGNTQMIHIQRGRVGSAIAVGFMWTVGWIVSGVGLAKAIIRGD